MVEMGTKAAERIHRFSDWLDISREVKRRVNEDSNHFVVQKGGFCVMFKETEPKPLGDELRVVEGLREENAKLRAENSLLKHGLVECCDRLWYFYGKTDGRLSDVHAQNVYDVAKYHLDKASAVRFCKIVLR